MTNSYYHQKERCKKYGREKPTYTLKELHHRFLDDPIFLKIYEKWVENGYKYYDIPSIDRIDASKGYSMDNIQVMTWQSNRQKGDIENSHSTTEVIQCKMDGTIIKIFISMKDAVKQTGCHQGLISACCNNQRTHTGGYKWKYGSYKRKLSNNYKKGEQPCTSATVE